MCNWVGRFNLILLILCFTGSSFSRAADESFSYLEETKWADFSREVKMQEKQDFKDGLSYIISGSLALVGGILGSKITEDPLEKGIYTVFQTIGIASVGYGIYTWQIGGEDRTLYLTLQESRLTAEQKTLFLRSYATQKKEREKKERVIKAITHGLIAGLNFYNGMEQTNKSLQSGLYFIGGVNLLAAISYTFEF